MTSRPGRRVTELLRDGGAPCAGNGIPLWEHPQWRERFPWLIQGVTGTGPAEQPLDMALFGDCRTRDVMERWWALARATGALELVHGHQVHREAVRVHVGGRPGLHVHPGTDGHVTRTPGVLLTVSVADCVPISLVEPERRAVALLHGGWRGISSGILERAVAVLAERLAARAENLHLHLGPAICGECYEVGAEVHVGLGLPAPRAPAPVDLRSVLAERARQAGVPDDHITTSTHCTRCEHTAFFSHRTGHTERQAAVLGIRTV